MNLGQREPRVSPLLSYHCIAEAHYTLTAEDLKQRGFLTRLLNIFGENIEQTQIAVAEARANTDRTDTEVGEI